MSSAAPSLPSTRTVQSPLAKFARSAIGLKLLMAVSGIVLSGFVLMHVLGNLSAFGGPKVIDEYGAKLHAMPTVLWAVRIVLLASLALHLYAYFLLTLRNQKARPQRYAVNTYKESSHASRTMRFTGPLLLLFVVYHLLHLTTGSAHPDFREGKVYHNLVTGLQQVPVALIYLAAMIVLGFHLWHGIWSLTQSMGVSQARYGSPGRRIATVLTVLVVLGFASLPIAVLTGILR